MSEKSHVTMVQRVCVCCGEEYDTGELAIDTRIRNGKLMQTFDQYTVMGAGLCPKCTEETREKGGVWLFSVTQKDRHTAYVDHALCFNEKFLREEILPDLPPTPDCICQCKSSLMAQLQQIADKAQEAKNASADATA